MKFRRLDRRIEFFVFFNVKERKVEWIDVRVSGKD